MKSLNLRKLSLLTVLAGSILSYNAYAAAEGAGVGAEDVVPSVPVTVRLVGTMDPTVSDVAGAQDPSKKAQVPSCWNCWGGCSPAVVETTSRFVTLAASGVNAVAAHGDMILDLFEAVSGKKMPKELRDAIDMAEKADNELKVVFNAETGQFYTWDESRGKVVERFVSAAEIKYREMKHKVHPAGRLVIRYFFDHATELVAGTEAVASDPSSLLRLIQTAEGNLLNMFERDMDESSTRLQHVAGSLKLVDADGDGEVDDLIITPRGEAGTISFDALIAEVKGVVDDFKAHPDNQYIDFTGRPTLQALNATYGILTPDTLGEEGTAIGRFKSLFEVAGRVDAGAGVGASAAVAATTDDDETGADE